MNKKQRILLLIIAALLLVINIHCYGKYQAINQPEVIREKGELPYFMATRSNGVHIDVGPIYFKIIFIDITIIMSGLLVFWALKNNKQNQ